MPEYKAIYVMPATQARIKELTLRDARPTWKIVADAVAYYLHVHKTPREPQAATRKRGRPPGSRNTPQVGGTGESLATGAQGLG